ncbi:Cof family protein [Lacticaseibacillus sharpeae JCM 1186 = DSM 20505]|uniref:Cof family protein n=1 Tax=Lacticaseibacillus sharpeae JCM 1186 = DSM 20505 TaxID=1291052 RepID=A0A0R1ZJP1_9LACO|nr:Cof family protein [Lacticaseibacillus sharpeae JCM 1186 = DSM 20505]
MYTKRKRTGERRILQNLYNESAEFHKIFDDRQPATPTALDHENLVDRVGFILEELTEMATIGCQTPDEIEATFAQVEARLQMAKTKILRKQPSVYPPIVQQADALGDIAYLTFGSYVLMGVDPDNILATIHAANMHKLFPDGQAHRDPVTGKVLKPASWAAQYQPEPLIAQEIARQGER